MKALRSLCAADLMTSQVFAIPSQTPVSEAAKMLLSRNFSGAPVIDATRNCVGVVSIRDIARYEQCLPEVRVDDHDFYSATRIERSKEEIAEFILKRDPNQTVDHIMTPLVLAVEEDAPIAEVVRLILHHHVHRVFVMDEDRHLVGIVSTVDVLGALLDSLDDSAGNGAFTPTASAEPKERRLPRRRSKP
jgi:CBS domain-containing protein